MEEILLNNPRLPLVALILLGASDLLLVRLIRRPGFYKGDEFFAYEDDEYPEPGAGGIAYFAFVLLRISPAFLVLLLWAVAATFRSPVSVWFYQAVLGFSLFLFLITNLRHLETIMAGFLMKLRRADLSGKVAPGRSNSVGYSTIRLITLLIILAVIAAIRFKAFYIGAAVAPLSLIFRNLRLMSR